MIRTPSAVFSLLFLLVCGVVQAQEKVEVTEVAPNVLVFATSSGNVVASVGLDGALLIGTPSAASTQQIGDILAKHTTSAVRYVVIGPQETAGSQGDAGWTKRGAFVAMQEKALDRLGGHAMGSGQPLPPHLKELGVDRPRIAFSEVLTFDLNGDAIHVVHQPPAYSNADSIVHFHNIGLLYFGDVFPGDGYPDIDAAQGGKLDGVTKMLQSWTGSKFTIVPARGKVMNGADVKAYLDMLAAVREHVQHGIDAGRTEEEIVAEHPTAEFDAKWGHGRITPAAFVHEVYVALRTP